MAESSKRGFSLPPESKSKKTCSEIDICGHVYNSDDDYDDISDEDLSGSCSSTSVDLTDEETVTSEGSSISMMDDGPCDYVSKDCTKWWNEPPSDFHQDEYFSKDFQPQLVGPSMESDTCGDFFKLFITHESCSYILSQTNNKLESYLPLNQVPNPQKKYLYAITLEELYTFLGMMILFGVFRSSKEKISNLYSDDPNDCGPIIKCSMPRDRFKVILRFLRFDDLSTRLERTFQDKLAPIRFVFDSINTTLSETYTLGKWLTVDEHMTGYRGRCPIMQFMSVKPDKYGIKIFILADAKTYFPCAMEVVLELSPGHFVAGDNFFTSKMLSDQFLTKYKTYYMEMLRRDRREIPKEMKDTKGVSIHSSRLYTHNKDIVH
ncbi:PiggyBac transposable element-derived protein 4 [Oopsacas minuta]|uniref:PiggyBac transposable element-derived protein 4 n=1 Tax=Oopsacas minuta TaxID=111878 RepID=A0AAV7JMN9_9METZ|nr:PiggyBac transposable element-derived protein 4 [Oopsacas minuta]